MGGHREDREQDCNAEIGQEMLSKGWSEESPSLNIKVYNSNREDLNFKKKNMFKIKTFKNKKIKKSWLAGVTSLVKVWNYPKLLLQPRCAILNLHLGAFILSRSSFGLLQCQRFLKGKHRYFANKYWMNLNVLELLA